MPSGHSPDIATRTNAFGS
ncbi:hypothetical protein F383_39386 [Gossypium arboreum]|uniref:Uncharacterized protein n=1 Tax=Gossypium arboreum TaxID=29729 RepID=A0A0B0MK18_GOSAR|nr:hypothetical protein F383_39386 [Gossypium arboreum]